MGKPVDDRVVEFIEVLIPREILRFDVPYTTNIFNSDQEISSVQYRSQYEVTYLLKNANGDIITDNETGEMILKTVVHETDYTDVPLGTQGVLQEVSSKVPQWFKDDYLLYTGKSV